MSANSNSPSERNNNSNSPAKEHTHLQKLFTKLASLLVQKFAALSQKFQLFAQKFRLVAVTSALSLLLGIMTFFPQSASAGLFSAKDSTPTLSVGMGGGSKSGGTAKKVGKFVVTIGAIGAGATTANVLRNKFTSCSDDNDDDDDDEEESSAASPHKNEPHKNEATKNESKTKGTTTNDDKSEIQPLSAEWIQQQLSDVERRSNVVNDAIKMTQQSSSSQPPPTAPPSASGGVNKSGGTSKIVTNGSSTTKTPTKKQQLSVGNTIGIPNNTKNPLVKNLDSKIEMLQRRDAERTSQAQRFHDEEMKVKEEQKKVAIVEAERKIDLAEKEYKKKSQQQQQVVETKQQEVEEEESTITTTSAASTPPQPSKVFGPGGQPAKSKEEDLELTTQVILEYVKSMESSSDGGGVDDSGDDE